MSELLAFYWKFISYCLALYEYFTDGSYIILLQVKFYGLY